MGREIQKGIAVLLALTMSVLSASAREKEQSDSLVRFVKGSSIQLIEKDGQPYRKAVDATFLHNGTYLICDTAIWNVNEKVINAEGNVRIIQDETVLSSDKLDYLIDDNLAQFRGSVVQLRDKQNNTLRTCHLDYNTRDSVAVFKNGGSMKDKDGQIIESLEGTYDSAGKRFTFRANVNMFTDSVFVKTNELEYLSDSSKAIFKTYIDFWKDGNMMSASKGWYDRPVETFFFEGRVHAMTKDQETWSDSLYFYRKPNDVKLLGNAQVQDTTRNVFALADYIYYVDSLSRVTLQRRAAVAIRTEEEEKVDTVYFGADTLVYYTVKKCDIPEYVISESGERAAEMFVDPVMEYRRKAAKEAAEAAAAAAREAEELAHGGRKVQGGGKPAETPEKPKEGKHREGALDIQHPEDKLKTEAADSLKAELPDSLKTELADSLKTEPADSLLTEAADSLAQLPPPDTTKIGFLRGMHNIRIFKKDIQVRADSMLYNDLDSIARFYIDPVVWNEGNRQYSSDSLFVLVKKGGMDRASLMSNAFIITREDSLCFDQIKATEVMAYFDSTSALRRFDALGGATAYFYLEENDVLATMNKVESKMLSAWLKKGEVDRIFYFDSPKNDAYPVAQLRDDERVMRGFNWQDDRRPASKDDVTTLVLKPSERTRYAARPKARFTQTDKYFPGYIESVYRGIEYRDSLRQVRRQEEVRLEKEAQKDSLAAVQAPEIETEEKPSDAAKDTTEVKKTPSAPAAPPRPLNDSLRVVMTKMGISADSLRFMIDTLHVSIDSLYSVYKPTPQELEGARKAAEKEAKKAQSEAKRKARLDAREAKWNEMDARDAAKAGEKARKALERKRERTRRILIRKQKQDAKDAAKLEKYKKRYAARKGVPLPSETENDKENGETDRQVPALHSGEHPIQ